MFHLRVASTKGANLVGPEQEKVPALNFWECLVPKAENPEMLADHIRCCKGQQRKTKNGGARRHFSFCCRTRPRRRRIFFSLFVYAEAGGRHQDDPRGAQRSSGSRGAAVARHRAVNGVGRGRVSSSSGPVGFDRRISACAMALLRAGQLSEDATRRVQGQSLPNFVIVIPPNVSPPPGLNFPSLLPPICVSFRNAPGIGPTVELSRLTPDRHGACVGRGKGAAREAS
ncbi:unnamed protein product [Prorocentrum cordatum]|uniref:Uncharacterized protein n=1 Tax=Prorocentrum cordatum TaxID=2364126 RepID=A0ABN9VTB3_9DINO|nr:unnamed protein product [Polarella glacialis]